MKLRKCSKDNLQLVSGIITIVLEGQLKRNLNTARLIDFSAFIFTNSEVVIMLIFFTNEDKGKWYEGILQALFADNYKKAYNTAYKITFDKELAKDATQEAFLRAFKGIDTLKDKNKFSAWLCSITANVCYDMLRQIIIQKDNSVPFFNNEEDTREPIVEQRDFNIPEKIYENKEIRLEIKKCINEMPHDMRQILVLRIYQGLSYAEIAEYMDMNENTVKTKIHRAKVRIEKMLRSFADLEMGEGRSG